MLGVSLGILLAKYMPWVDPERWGPVVWTAHLKAIYLFAIPNAFFMAALLFAIAVLARNEIISFVEPWWVFGWVTIFVSLAIPWCKTSAMSMLRPCLILSGYEPSALFTKYWTVGGGKIQLLRDLKGFCCGTVCYGLGFALAIFIFACFKFDFA